MVLAHSYAQKGEEMDYNSFRDCSSPLFYSWRPARDENKRGIRWRAKRMLEVQRSDLKPDEFWSQKIKAEAEATVKANKKIQDIILSDEEILKWTR